MPKRIPPPIIKHLPATLPASETVDAARRAVVDCAVTAGAQLPELLDAFEGAVRAEADERVAQVRRIHYELGMKCHEDGFRWPCQTIRALDAAPDGGGGIEDRTLEQRIADGDAYRATPPASETVADERVAALMQDGWRLYWNVTDGSARFVPDPTVLRMFHRSLAALDAAPEDAHKP